MIPLTINQKREVVETLGYRIAFGSAVDVEDLESWLWSHQSFGLAAYFVDSEEDAIYWAFEDACQMFDVVIENIEVCDTGFVWSFNDKYKLL